MKVDPDELAQLVRTVDGVFDGKPPPRAGKRFGQYLRRCAQGRFEIQQLLAREGITTSARGWVNGEEVGSVVLAPLAPPEGSVPNNLLGPVEHVPALVEALGSVVDLTLWTSAASANRAHVLLYGSLTPVKLSGTYRWFAPSRITPGEATVEAIASDRVWVTTRFLKATADDVARAPHALEYVLDYRIGTPGLKVFRTLAVSANGDGFSILPGIDAPARPIHLVSHTDRLSGLRDGETAIVFAYVEPWSKDWVVVDAEPTDAAGCLAHLLTWADFKAEIEERQALNAADLVAVRRALLDEGLEPPEAFEVVGDIPARELARPARALVRWLRYRV